MKHSNALLLLLLFWGALLVLGTPYKASAETPSGVIASLELSPDGSKLALSGSDGAWIYSIALNEYVKFSSQVIHDIVWSPDGNYLATAKLDSPATVVIEVWDAETLMIIKTIRDAQTDQSLRFIDWNPANNYIAVNGDRLKVWDAISGNLIYTPDQKTDYVRYVGWNSDGSLLATSHRGIYRIWDISSPTPIKEIPSTETASKLAWGTNGIAVEEGSIIRIWSLDSDDNYYDILLASNTDIENLAWKQQTLVAEDEDGIIYVINTDTRQVEQTLNLGENLTTFTLSSDGSSLVYIANDWSVKFVDLEIAPIPTPDTLRTKTAECVAPADRGLQTSLNAKINAKQWQAFINEVKAQSGKKITEECANQLIEMATYLRDHPPQ